MTVRTQGDAIAESIWAAVSVRDDMVALQACVFALLAKGTVPLAGDKRLYTHFKGERHDG